MRAVVEQGLPLNQVARTVGVPEYDGAGGYVTPFDRCVPLAGAYRPVSTGSLLTFYEALPLLHCR